jgi:hypothetical protein
LEAKNIVVVKLATVISQGVKSGKKIQLIQAHMVSLEGQHHPLQIEKDLMFDDCIHLAVQKYHISYLLFYQF